MTQYLVTITVDEDTLKQAYVESTLSSELNWLSNSGISFSDDIQQITPVRDRA